ncbi:MAG: elongation factor P [Planctomycetota bacterium]|jgi:elongation factor P
MIVTLIVPEWIQLYRKGEQAMRANDIKSGMAINLDGRLCAVVKTDHVKPGKGPAYVQVKAKDMNSGSTVEKRLGSTDDVDVATLDRREMEFLYMNGDAFVFMDNETYDQIELQAEFVAGAKEYLVANLTALVLMYEGNPVSLELPGSVELEVTDTPPGIKGATVTNQLKDATCETGLRTKVPQFVNNGDRIRVSTSEGAYQARVTD